MATIAEILAKKKAAAAAASKVEEQPDGKVTPVDPSDKGNEVIKTAPVIQKEEPATNAAPKPLTFAEKMALKRKQEEAKKTETTTSTDNGKNTIPEKEVVPNVVAAAPSVEQSAAVPATTPAKEDTGTAGDDVSPEARQAYADIKERLVTLNELSGTDLESAMKELKKALMQNPAAVSLMEDSDIGQLVIALRKITGETIAEAAKEKKNGNGGGRKRAKEVDLSDPNVVSAIFDEL